MLVVHLLGIPAGWQQGFQQLVSRAFAHFRPNEVQALGHAVVGASVGASRTAAQVGTVAVSSW